jgi:WD40 repeat protein
MGLAALMRLSLIRICIPLIIFMLSACRAVPASSPPPIQDGSPVSTVSSLTTTTAALPPATSPSPVLSATQAQVTLTPIIVPTESVPAVLAPATISGLEQVGLVEYSPWDLVLAVAWSPDGNLIAVAAGESIYLYTRDLQEQGQLPSGTWTTSLAFHPQGIWLASGGRDGQIRIWDVEKQRLIIDMAAHKKGVNAVAFSPDGSLLASAGNDAVSRLWDPLTGERLAQMIGGTYAVPSIVFSPDGAALAITNGELIRIRDVETSRFVYTLRSQGSNYSAAWSPDGTLLAAGNTAGDIFLWELLSKQPSGTFLSPVDTITAPDSLVWSLGFSPDGALLAAGDNRGTLYFWDVEKKDLLSAVSASSKGITSLAFSPDGRYLITGGLDGALRLWASH